MAIKKTPSGKWRVDFYVAGRRKRRDFSTKNSAEDFDRQRRLIELGAAPTAHVRKTLAEAMQWYHSTVSVTKASATARETERHFFKVLYECIRSNEVIGRKSTDAKIEYIDEVELSHLRSMQTYLTQQPSHGICKANERQRLRKDRTAELEAMQDFTVIQVPDKCRLKPETCRAKVISASTVNRYFSTWTHFFNLCDQNGWLRKNPAQYLEGLPESPKSKAVHADNTIQLIIDEAMRLASSPSARADGRGDGRLRYWADVADILYLLAKTGARPIEIQRLTFGDMNIDDLRCPTITLRSLKGRKRSGQDAYRIRTLPLTDELVEFFRERREVARRAFACRPSDRVFSSARGKMFDSKAFGRSVKILTTRLGIEDFTPYCLRHGFVTRGRKVGVSIDDAGDLAGHSNKETTRKIYDHSGADELRPAMSQIGSSLKIIVRREGKIVQCS